jgi:hypothetical protein
VPRMALDMTEPTEWVAVVDLYKRAHSLRWATFRVSERSMCTRWGLGNSRVWSLLADLEGAGLLTLEKGSKGKASRITVACPTRQPAESDGARQGQQQGEQQGQQQGGKQNEPGAKPNNNEAAAGVAAGVAAAGAAGVAENLMRLETEPENQMLREEKGAPLPLPAWLRAWQKDNAPQQSAESLLRVTCGGVSIITGRMGTFSPSKGYGRPVANAWRRLGFPDVGAVDQDPTHLPDTTFLGAVALLHDACKRCPAPVFRNDVRGFDADGENWKGRAPNLTPAVVLRLKGQHGKGATIEQRLTAAREWALQGRPTVPDAQPLPSAPRKPSRRNDGPRTIAEMIADGEFDNMGDGLPMLGGA